jgi:hypothetical protein
MLLFGIDLPDGLGKVGGPSDEFYQAMFPEDRQLLVGYHAVTDKQDSFPAEYRILKPDGKFVGLRVMATSSIGNRVGRPIA